MGNIDLQKQREAFSEFKKIYREYYKEEIDDDKARELGQNLLNVYRLVYREPSKKESNLSLK